jgi:integrase
VTLPNATEPPALDSEPELIQSAPLDSPEYIRVRSLLSEMGHRNESWDSLAFSLALLPNFRAHGVVLERFSDILDTPIFRSLEWVQGAWAAYVPAWRRLLRDWGDVRASIARETLPENPNWLDLPKQLTKDGHVRNPLRRHGISVAPIASLLVTQHEFSAHPSADRRAIADKFNHLQAMLTAACIELRWASQRTVEEYLSFAPTRHVEFAAHPTSAAAACLAARWLGEAAQAGLLDRFTVDPDPRTYVGSLAALEEELSAAASSKTSNTSGSKPRLTRGQMRMRALVGYFTHWLQLLAGAEQGLKRRRRSGETSPDRQGVTGVDGYIPPDPGTPAVDGAGSDLDSNGNGGEGDEGAGGGLPYEDISQPSLPQVSPDKVKGGLSKLQWQGMQAEMAANVLPWDLRYLAPVDADGLALSAIKALDASRNQWSAALQSTRADVLLTLMTLVLGQDPDELFNCRIALLQHPEDASAAGAPPLPLGLERSACTLEQALFLEIDHPVLLVSRSSAPSVLRPPTDAQREADHFGWVITGEQSKPDPLVAVAFLIPAIRPRLSTANQPSNLPPQTSGMAVRNLVLPAGEAGRRVLGDWYAHRKHTSIEVLWKHGFGFDRHDEQPSPASPTVPAPWGEAAFEMLEVEPVAPRARVERFLATVPPPAGHDYWPVRLLQQQLGCHIEAATGDRTLAWLVTRRTEAEGEARLYYTQHRLERLVHAYGEGLKRAGLARLLDHELHAVAADATSVASAAAATSAWATTVELWPWREPILSKHAVGAAFVPCFEDVQRLVKVLRESASAPVDLDSRSSLRNHHRWLLLHTLVLQSLSTGLRAVRSPSALLLALEQADRVREKAGLPETDDSIFAGLADKETYYSQRARLVLLRPLLIRQLRVLQQHQLQVIRRLDCVREWQASSSRIRAMFRLDADDKPAEVSVAWVEKELADLGFPWPANFARSFLRTQLLARGCPAADLDALLGHRDTGGGAIAMHSTFDYPASMARLADAIDGLHRDLNLQLCNSSLEAKGGESRDTEVLQAPMHDAGPTGRGRSFRVRHQQPELELSPFWRDVHDNATDDDRQQVQPLLKLLRSFDLQGNAFATLLCQVDPLQWFADRIGDILVDRSQMDDLGALPRVLVCDLEIADAVRDVATRLKLEAEAGTQLRFIQAISWFRLLLRARRKLESFGFETPETPLILMLRAPSSPFTERAVLVLPIVDGWRRGLNNWATEAFAQARRKWAAPKDKRSAPEPRGEAEDADNALLPEAPSVFSAEGWATALLVSATLNGMLLDSTQLSMLLRRFSRADGRDLPTSGPEQRAYLDFKVPASGSVDRQTHRWWFDPMTELIWLHAPPMPRELRLGDLRPWLRRLALQAFPGSTFMPFEPQSFSDLVRCAEVWWLARSSRAVVASQRRQVDASSILTNRWSRIAGAQRLVPPPFAREQPSASSARPKDASGESTASKSTGRGRRPPPPPTDIERLALVHHDTDKPSDQLVDFETSSADAELLAAMSAAHPWVQLVTEQLVKVAGQPALLDAELLRGLLSPSTGSNARTLVEFAQWLAAPKGGGFSGPALVRSFTAVAQAVLLALGDADDSAAPDASAIAEMISTLDDMPLSEGATLASLRQGLLRFAEFRGVKTEVLQQLDPDDAGADEDDDAGTATHADAKVLSHEEYEATMEALINEIHTSFSAAERSLGRLLLMLCYRIGLRPGEVYGMRLRDVTGSHLYVLPYGKHRLKSSNARRRVPHALLMWPKEHERLQWFVSQRMEHGAQPDDLLLAQGKNTPANRQHLDRWLHKVMRRVTLDPQIRLYHARHSFTTWTDLALRSVVHPEVLRFFSHLPRTRAFLERGAELAVGLFGSTSAALGKTSYALARWVGHVGPAITRMHYGHGDDLVRAAVVEREMRKVPKEEWMRILDLGKSTTFALFAKDEGFGALTQRARRLTGWQLGQVSLVDQTPPQQADEMQPPKSPVLSDGVNSPAPTPEQQQGAAELGGPVHSPDWIPLAKIVDLTQPIAAGNRTAEQMAGLHGLAPDRVQAIVTNLRALLPRAAQPGERATRDAESGLVSLPLSAEVSAMFARAERWMKSRAAVDPVGLRADLEFLLGAYDRRDRDFHVRDAHSLAKLTTLLVNLGLSPDRSKLIVRTVNPSQPVAGLPTCATKQALGVFTASPVKHIGVRSVKKAASYAKWLGIMAVTQSEGSCSSAYAAAAALGLSQL